MIKRLYLLLLFFILLSITSTSDASSRNRLTIFGVGAKAGAFNGAFTAIADDYSATFWNPAAISFFKAITVGGTHSQMSLDRTIDFLSIIYPMPGKNFVGVSWAGFKVADIEARTNNTSEPDFLFQHADRMIWLTYSRKILPQFSIGINLKFLFSHLSNEKALGWGSDLAMLFTPIDNLRFSLVLQDLESKLQWDTGTNEQFENIGRFGIAYRLNKEILVSGDLINRGGRLGWAMGTEVSLFHLLKIRSGWQDEVWTVGAGFSVYFLDSNIMSFNYTIKTDPFNISMFHILDFSIQVF